MKTSGELKLRKFSQGSKDKDVIQALLFFIIGIFIAFSIIGSLRLAFPFGLACGYLPYFFTRRRKEKERLELALLWPELIDLIISGLRSGMSLAETLIHLGSRGPEKSREIFLEAETILREQGDFPTVFARIKMHFADPIADQVCEVLDFARESGSRDITTILRTLGDHTRADIVMRQEIRAKHGWIKNSAVIATLAPWLLLLILSAQSTTLVAFSTSMGLLVLLLGALMSIVAFIWMGKVGKFEDLPRIFSMQSDRSRETIRAENLVARKSSQESKLRSTILRTKTEYSIFETKRP